MSWFTLDRNIVLYENQKYTKTDSLKLPIDPAWSRGLTDYTETLLRFSQTCEL